MYEANVSEYELDLDAFVTNTKLKYILLKNESHQIMRNLGSIAQNPSSLTFGVGSNTTQISQI